MPDGDVVTNCHVVKGASRLTVRVGQIERPATLRYSDWDRDVCALSSSGLNAPPATVGSSKTLKVGAKVYAIGAPKGLELTLSDGIVSSLRDLEGGRYIQTTAAISPGSSGGGLYDDNGALVGLTTFYFAEGQSLNFAVPIDWAKDLPRRSMKSPNAEQTTASWLSKLVELENQNDWTAMLAHCLLWTKARPESEQSWYSLGTAYVLTKQYSQAIIALQEALRINSEYASAWNNLGTAYYDTQQYSQAINSYRQAVRINPVHHNAWNNLGNSYERSKQYPKAITAYQQALRINPEFISALNSLGVAHYLTGNRIKVMEVYKRLRVLDPAKADKFFNSFILPNG